MVRDAASPVRVGVLLRDVTARAEGHGAARAFGRMRGQGGGTKEVVREVTVAVTVPPTAPAASESTPVQAATPMAQVAAVQFRELGTQGAEIGTLRGD